MQRNVYLQGDLGERFGNKFIVGGNSYKDIFKCIEANRPEFKPFLLECHEKDIGFTIEHQGELVDEDMLLLPIREGDVTISIIPAGSKSGVGKKLAAVVLYFVVGPWIAAKLSTAAAASFTTAYTAMATSLALGGIQQIMAPDPSVDQDAPENYAFNGNAQNIVEGDPIPLLYGELRVPGRPVSIDITPGGYTGNSGVAIGSEYYSNAAEDAQSYMR